MSGFFTRAKLFTRNHRRLLLLAMAGVVFLRLIIPCPLRGNYLCRFTYSHGCDAHAFVRFANGRATLYHDGTKPSQFGNYEKTGWNTYALIWNGKRIGTIKSVWFFATSDESDLGKRMWRDYHWIDSTRIIFQVHDRRLEPLDRAFEY